MLHHNKTIITSTTARGPPTFRIKKYGGETFLSPDNKPSDPWLKFSLLLIQGYFLDSITVACNIVNILEKLLEKLLHKISDVPSNEFDFFTQFLSGLRECIAYRKNSFEIMDLSTHFITTMEYILVWLMHKGYPIDAFIISRRKALVSDLRKIVKKSIRYAKHLQANPCKEFLYPTDIYDRFGSTILVNNSENSNDLIYRIYQDGIKGILCGESSELRQDFINWCSQNPYINSITKLTVLGFLENIHLRRLNFEPTDYIANPKPNGYQALQDVLIAENVSYSLPTLTLDIHLTDSEKNKHATLGDGNHSGYKEEWYLSDPDLSAVSEFLDHLFDVPPDTQTQIPGYMPDFNPNSVSEQDAVMLMSDSDGIRNPAMYARRHLSPSLCSVPLQYQ